MNRYIAKILDLFFILGVPCGLSAYTYFSQPGVELNSWGTVGFFGIIGMIIVILIVKKKKIDPYFKDIIHILNNHRADYEIETDPIKKEKLRTSINKRSRKVMAYRRMSMLIIMLILYASVYYINKNIEQLQSVLGFSMLSMGLGSFIGFKWDVEPPNEEPTIPGAE